MALILNIDTALETASLSLAEKGIVLATAENAEQQDHAAWIHSAIKQLLSTAKKSMDQLDAVAVSNGPGSYTGLRVGLSTAKGLCYALNIPLITCGTLEIMAFSAKNSSIPDCQPPTGDCLVSPLIDARRMEVYAAAYDRNMKEVMKPTAMVLDEHSFEDLLKWHKIHFLGNGSEKFRQMCKHSHAVFKNLPLDPAAMAILSYKDFIGNNFAGLAYTEPLYLKEFYSRQ